MVIVKTDCETDGSFYSTNLFASLCYLAYTLTARGPTSARCCITSSWLGVECEVMGQSERRTGVT